MEIRYDAKELERICSHAIEIFFSIKEEEIYSAIKGFPFSILFEKKKMQIIGELDSELLYLLFDSTSFTITQGSFSIYRCVKKDSLFESDEQLEICKGDSYLVQNKKRARLIFRVPNEFERYALESFKPEPETDGSIYYKIESPLITLELVKQKETDLISISEYGLNLAESLLEPRMHFLSFLESQKIKFSKDDPFYSAIEKTYNKIFAIDKYTKDDLFNINKRRFVEKTLDLVVEKQDSPFFEKQFANVVECISSLNSCKDIVTSFVTYLHAMASLRLVKDETLLDYTEQALGLFKAAEILFYDLLRNKCSGFSYTNKNREIEYKDISKRNKTTLGDLSRVFYTTDKKLLECLSNKNTDHLRRIINDWINYDRNDHLHKDIIQAKEDLMSSLSSTIEVIFELVDMFY